MVWVLRVGLGLVILAYATWLAWPVAELLAGGVDVATVWRLAGGGDGPGAAMAALWIAVVVLYVVSGALTAAGLSWAPGAWLLAFSGEILLRLDRSTGDATPSLTDIAARTAEGLRQLGVVLDPAPLSIAGLLATGCLIVGLGAWHGQKGDALTRSWTEAPDCG